MDVLPLEILVRVAYNDWRAWANLALACPRFCVWAAKPEQVAMFMRQFAIKESPPLILCWLDNRSISCSWFDYPIIINDYYTEWKYRDGPSYRLGIVVRSLEVAIANFDDEIMHPRSQTEPYRYCNGFIIHNNYVVGDDGARTFYHDNYSINISTEGDVDIIGG